MRLIDEILSDSNIDRAILQVKRNKGVSGVDKMTVDELDEYFYKHRREIRYSILNKNTIWIKINLLMTKNTKGDVSCRSCFPRVQR